MNAAEQLVEALVNEDVSFVFGIPGDENLPFIEAVSKSEQITFVLTRHEAAAGFMAAAHGHLTGKLAVAMSTLGAGATNLMTSVAHAWLAESPMIVLTGQKPILDNMQGRYQLLNVVDLMTPITKSSTSVTSAAALPGIIAEAIQTALEYPQGPVHIELPLDVSSEPVGPHPLLAIGRSDQPMAAHKALDDAAAVLKAATRPLVLIGASANARDGVPEALREFLSATGIPFICTMMGKGVGDEMSDQFLGSAGMPGMGPPHCAVQHSDVVLAIGHNVMEKAPFVMSPGDDGTVIHLHDSPAIADTIWFPQHQVIGDIAHSITNLTSQLTASVAPERPPEGVTASTWDFAGFAKIRAAAVASMMAEPEDPIPGVLKPQHVARTVRKALGPQDIVSLDNGIHKLWMTRNYPALQPRTILVDSALGSMGTGIPAAIAAKLVHPDRNVVAVIGDGGFLMSGQEVETAVRLDLDLSILIFNDGGLGMIRLKQEMLGNDVHGVNFGSVDVTAFAAGFGATGIRVTSIGELDQALADAQASGGVHVIDVPVDYGENAKLMAQMKMIDCAAIVNS